jgi:hypothetical protein
MKTVGVAVAGLEDLAPLVPVLKGLGKKHVGYGVVGRVGYLYTTFHHVILLLFSVKNTIRSTAASMVHVNQSDTRECQPICHNTK